MLKISAKSLWAHKLRFLLTFFAVLIGVSFISGTMMLSDTITGTFNDLFSNVYKGTDVVVQHKTTFNGSFGSGEQRPRIPESIIAKIQSGQGLQDAVVAGDIQLDYAQLLNKKGKAIGNPERGAPALGFSWTNDKELNPWRLESGSKPPVNNNEIVIDAGSAKKGKLKVGDEVTVLTQQPSTPYKISGIAKFGTANSPAGASVVLFTLPQAQRIADATGQLNSISIRGASSSNNLSETAMQKRVSSALRDEKGLDVETGNQVAKDQQNDIAKNLHWFTIGLQGFAALSLLIGMFVIYNTFNIVIAQRIREMALMRALGASRKQIIGSVLAESLMVGLFASVLGVLAGIGLSSGLTKAFAALGIDLPTSGVVIKPQSVIIPIIAGVAVTVISALLPARRASKVPPVAAMRDVSVERVIRTFARGVSGGIVLLLAAILIVFGVYSGITNGYLMAILGSLIVLISVFILMPLIVRPLGRFVGAPVAKFRRITGRVARENATRNPKRTASTSMAIVICVMLIAAISIFASSVKESVNASIDSSLKADLVVTFGGFGGGSGVGLSPQVAKTISNLPQVCGDSSCDAKGHTRGVATGFRFGPAQVKGSGTFITGLDPVASQRVVDLNVTSGHLTDLNSPSCVTNGLSGCIAILRNEATSRKIREGDVLPLRFVNTVSRPEKFRVAAIFDGQSATSSCVISLASYQKFFVEQLDQEVLVRFEQGTNVAVGENAVKKALKPYPTAQVLDQTAYKNQIAQQINQFVVLLYILLLMAIIISLLGIVNTLSLSIYERIRELGLVRAVGMLRRQVRSTIRWESVIVTLIGTIVGLAMGLLYGWLFVKGVNSQGISSFKVPGAQLVIVIFGAMFFGMCAAIFPAIKAARIDMLKAVEYE